MPWKIISRPKFSVIMSIPGITVWNGDHKCSVGVQYVYDFFHPFMKKMNMLQDMPQGNDIKFLKYQLAKIRFFIHIQFIFSVCKGPGFFTRFDPFYIETILFAEENKFTGTASDI